MIIRILFMSLVLAVCAGNKLVWAADKKDSPKQIVENLYKPYLADPHAEKLGGPGALNLILPYASKSLQSAIHRNDECEQREQGICKIDFDVIINAQDWHLSNFTLQETRQNKVPVVHATFSNGGKNNVSYFFIQEHGDWKIDEIGTVRYKINGVPERRFILKKELMR